MLREAGGGVCERERERGPCLAPIGWCWAGASVYARPGSLPHHSPLPRDNTPSAAMQWPLVACSVGPSWCLSGTNTPHGHQLAHTSLCVVDTCVNVQGLPDILLPVSTATWRLHNGTHTQLAGSRELHPQCVRLCGDLSGQTFTCGSLLYEPQCDTLIDSQHFGQRKKSARSNKCPQHLSLCMLIQCPSK